MQLVSGMRPPGAWYPGIPRPPPGVLPMAPLPTGPLPQPRTFMPIHYPSQDPQRMGSIEKLSATSTSTT